MYSVYRLLRKGDWLDTELMGEAENKWPRVCGDPDLEIW